MANYRKSFNFRNGVQVDNDNFIVDTNGLVGIGTSIPTELLDVRGTAKVSGVVTTTDLWVTEDVYVGGITTTSSLKVGTAVTITGGIVTATRFSGDGSQLTGLSQAAWTINSSGLSTSADVGIGTTNPLFKLQIGESPLTGNGVGIDSIGNIYVSAGATFNSVVDINAALDVDGQTDLDELVVAGVSTFSALLDVNVGANIVGGLTLDQLTVTGVSTFADDAIVTAGGLDVTGVGTFTQLDIGTGGIDVDGTTDLDVLNVAETATFSSAVDINAGLDVDGQADLDEVIVAGVATFSSAIDANGALDVQGITTFNSNVYVSGVSTFTGAIDANGSLDILRGLDVSGQTNLSGVNISGIGTFNNGSVKIAVTSGGTSGLSTFYGLVKYGNENGAFPYSTRRSVDLINYDTGNVNFYLDADNIGINTGDFHWHKGSNNSRLMTLTNNGKLGIGITLPEYALHVSGIATFTGAVYTLGNLTVGNNLTINNNLTVSNVSSNVTGNVTGNIKSVGVSTLYDLEVSRFVGIATVADTNTLFKVNPSTEARVSVNYQGKIAIGTETARGAVDFGEGGSDETKRFMIPPLLDASVGIASLTSIVTGALIYNTTTNKLQVYTGSGWENCN
tara:strand:+ start:148 stop:2007 length:1860 start_codon:yes stop_codon:yes gene_type:complete